MAIRLYETQHIEEAVRTLRLSMVDYARKEITGEFLLDDVEYAIEQLGIAKQILTDNEHTLKRKIPINGWNCIESVIIVEAIALLDGAVIAYDWSHITKENMLERLRSAIKMLNEVREIVEG